VVQALGAFSPVPYLSMARDRPSPTGVGILVVATLASTTALPTENR
jgi:hypothetical protein